MLSPSKPCENSSDMLTLYPSSAALTFWHSRQSNSLRPQGPHSDREAQHGNGQAGQEISCPSSFRRHEMSTYVNRLLWNGNMTFLYFSDKRSALLISSGSYCAHAPVPPAKVKLRRHGKTARDSWSCGRRALTALLPTAAAERYKVTGATAQGSKLAKTF